MDILGRDKISLLFESKNESEIEVVEHFLGLLNILMSFPGSTFQSYLTHILQLTISGIYPHVAGKEEFIGVKESIFQVLYTILLTHWNNCGDQELQLVMKAFQHSFQQLSDLPVFKRNLFYLRDLNNRNRLFSKEFFAIHWKNEFLYTFLKLLFDGMHRILEDEIIPIIFDLASVDLNGFFGTILPSMISQLPLLQNQKSQLLQEFSHDCDSPTFSRNIQQLLSGYRVLSLGRE